MSLTWARRRRSELAGCGHGEEIAALVAEVGRLRRQAADHHGAYQQLNARLTRVSCDAREYERLLKAALDRVAELTAALADAAQGRDTALGLLEAREERPEWPDAGAVTGVPEVDDLRARCRALERRVADLQRANEDRDWATHRTATGEEVAS